MSSLCENCGLCCDGSFFSHVPLSDAEAVSLAGLGLPVRLEGGQFALPLGCCSLNGTRCSIYKDRPAACRTYECVLLRKLKAGAIGAVEAKGIVEQTKAVRAEAGADLKKLRHRVTRGLATEAEAEALHRLDSELRAHFLDEPIASTQDGLT